MTTQMPEFSRGRAQQGLLYGALAFCLYLALYGLTAQRGVSWQDSGEFQFRVLSGDFAWCSGIARAHPLYIGLARAWLELFPDSAALYAVTVFSGLGMALALALLAMVVWGLTGSAVGVAVAVGTLGFSHMAWWLSTVAEVYTWSLSGLMGELYCLVRFAERRRTGWLIALFAVNGAHAALHNFAFLSLPVYAALLLSEMRRLTGASSGSLPQRWAQVSAVAGCAGVAWLGGAWLLVGQVVADWGRSGDALATLRSLLFGAGYETLVLGQSDPVWRQVAANLALAALSFLSPCWLFALRGWPGAAKLGPVRGCLVGLTILHGLFWCRYFVPDQATFVLPTLGLLAVWSGLGCHASRWATRTKWAALFAGAVCAVAVPKTAAELLRSEGVSVSRSRALPFRDELRYWLVPWKQNEDSAARFVVEVDRQLQGGDVLVADATVSGPLLAARAAGDVRADWRLITPWSGEHEEALLGLLKRDPGRFYLVSPVAGYAPRALLESAAGFERTGVLYRARSVPPDARQGARR